MSESEVRVRTRNLVKEFGNFRAVDDVSLEVKSGEIFGFLGSNGAGKTTTIRILCGLLAPTSGEAWVNNINVAQDPEAVRRNIGYMSQRFSLYTELTVAENLSFFGGIYGVPPGKRKQRSEEILELFELAGRRDQVTSVLPGGLRQRLALGCAVLHEPSVLFLDEPTSGVDPLARRIFWDLIRDLSARGKTVFVTTHYMDEASNCDRLALMHRGKIIALDTPSGLLGKLESGRLLALDSSHPNEVVEHLQESSLVREAWLAASGVNVLLRSRVRPQELVDELTAAGLDIDHVRAAQPNIEDVFISLIEAEEEVSA